ncbi:MAG: permease prefix domain 1-containing protein [Defluviitaleaceae bacterium]|nr:permease prefix domain 1-containing protein [Defluviitaleaceae bacterium]
MDTIKTYLDNVFAAFPQTNKVQTIKRDMLTGMEEKYVALRQQGKNEDEAVGIVIANFGSVDEISQELGVAITSPQQDITKTDDTASVITMSLQEARSYLSKSRGVGYAMGIACFMLTIGISTALITQAAESIGVMIPLVIGGIIIMLITAYRASKDFERYQKANISLAPIDHMILSEDRARFKIQSIFIGAVTGIAVLSLMAVALEGHTNIPFIIAVGFTFFRLPVALTTRLGYDYLLGNWQYKLGRWTYVR